jgi:hypothetical protein
MHNAGIKVDCEWMNTMNKERFLNHSRSVWTASSSLWP